MARFSKATLLKWLEAQQQKAEQSGEAAKYRAKCTFYDGQAVAFLATIRAIERGEIETD